jgi:hypothetical protein
MKRKLPKPRDGRKDAACKTNRFPLEDITFHKTMATIMWQMMDVIHHQSSGSHGTLTLDVMLSRLMPLDTIEKDMPSYSMFAVAIDGAKLRV